MPGHPLATDEHLQLPVVLGSDFTNYVATSLEALD